MSDGGMVVELAAQRRAEIAAAVQAERLATAAARTRCRECVVEAGDVARAWSRSVGVTLTFVRQHLIGA